MRLDISSGEAGATSFVARLSKGGGIDWRLPFRLIRAGIGGGVVNWSMFSTTVEICGVHQSGSFVCARD